MIIRIDGLGVRSRPAAIALAAAALAVGAVFVAFGIFLLLGLAAVGTIVGIGVFAFRALTGRATGHLRAPMETRDLEPSLEVFPSQAAAPPPPHKLANSQAHKPE